MFKSISKFFAKQLLPIILANLILDVDTVQKQEGYYLRIRVEAMGFKLIDELIKLSSTGPDEMSPMKTLTLDDPVDVVRANQLDHIPERLSYAALGKNYKK